MADIHEKETEASREYTRELWVALINKGLLRAGDMAAALLPVYALVGWKHNDKPVTLEGVQDIIERALLNFRERFQDPDYEAEGAGYHTGGLHFSMKDGRLEINLELGWTGYLGDGKFAATPGFELE